MKARFFLRALYAPPGKILQLRSYDHVYANVCGAPRYKSQWNYRTITASLEYQIYKLDMELEG